MSDRDKQDRALRRQVISILGLPENSQTREVVRAVLHTYDRYVETAGTISKMRQEMNELSERVKRAEEDALRTEFERMNALQSADGAHQVMTKRIEEERQLICDIVAVAVAAAAGRVQP